MAKEFQMSYIINKPIILLFVRALFVLIVSNGRITDHAMASCRLPTPILVISEIDRSLQEQTKFHLGIFPAIGIYTFSRALSYKKVSIRRGMYAEKNIMEKLRESQRLFDNL